MVERRGIVIVVLLVTFAYSKIKWHQVCLVSTHFNSPLLCQSTLGFSLRYFELGQRWYLLVLLHRPWLCLCLPSLSLRPSHLWDLGLVVLGQGGGWVFWQILGTPFWLVFFWWLLQLNPPRPLGASTLLHGCMCHPEGALWLECSPPASLPLSSWFSTYPAWLGWGLLAWLPPGKSSAPGGKSWPHLCCWLS